MHFQLNTRDSAARHLRSAAVWSAVALCLAPAFAQPPQKARPAAFEKLRPLKLRAPLPGRTAVTQFAAADRKGNLYLLRGDTLEVFRVRPAEGELRPLGKLACRKPLEGAHAAAMDSSGSTWVVSSTPFDLATCDFTEEKRPSGWSGIISSLAYSRTSPLVAVVPFGGGLDAGKDIDKRKPRIFTLEGSRWVSVFSPPTPILDKAAPYGMVAHLKAETDSLLCQDAKGAIWSASWNAYRIQRIVGSSGVPDRELTVGRARIEWVDLSSGEKQGIASAAERKGLDPTKNQAGSAQPRNVIRSILCGQDGYVYTVASTAEGLALDRFDPTPGSVERILLEGVEVGRGPMTMAFGKEELLLAGRLVRDGLWRIPLSALETARWEQVPGATLDGRPLS